MPVEFNVKELPNVNKIYMTVTMTKIKEADIMAHPPNLIGWERANQLPNYTVAQLIKFVNSSEGEFFKYIPDALLSNEQIASKRIALQKEQEKLEVLKAGNRQYSISEDSQGRELSLEERLSGDALLDAQDLIAEIENVAEVSENGYVTVYVE